MAKTPFSISEYSKDGNFEKNINLKIGIVIPKNGPIYITPLTYNFILSPKGGNSSVLYNLKEEICYDDSSAIQYFKRELIYNGGSGSAKQRIVLLSIPAERDKTVHQTLQELS